eukprot:scaffold19159_cov64-Phaeocystis_antarctica.AAC.3
MVQRLEVRAKMRVRARLEVDVAAKARAASGRALPPGSPTAAPAPPDALAPFGLCPRRGW